MPVTYVPGVHRPSPLQGLPDALGELLQAWLAKKQQAEQSRQIGLIAQLLNPQAVSRGGARVAGAPGADIVQMITQPAAAPPMTRDQLLARAIGSGVTNPRAVELLLHVAQGFPERASQATVKVGQTREVKRGGQIVTEEWDGTKWAQIGAAPRFQPRQAGETRTITRGGQLVTEEWDGTKWAQIGAGDRFAPPAPPAFKTWQKPDGSVINLPANEAPPAGSVPYSRPGDPRTYVVDGRPVHVKPGEMPPEGALPAGAALTQQAQANTQAQRMRTHVAKIFGITDEMNELEEAARGKVTRAIVKAQQSYAAGVPFDEAADAAIRDIEATTALRGIPAQQRGFFGGVTNMKAAKEKAAAAVNQGARAQELAEQLAAGGWVQAGGDPFRQITEVLRYAGVDPDEVAWPDDLRAIYKGEGGDLTYEELRDELARWGQTPSLVELRMAFDRGELSREQMQQELGRIQGAQPQQRGRATGAPSS